MTHIVTSRSFEIGTASHAYDAAGLYARAASLVSLGAWSCDLSTESLEWTDGVFDMFGFPKGAAPNRQDAVDCYDEQSRALLQATRSRAIETCSPFSIDAKIKRLDGDARWIRITAGTRHSNGRAVELYGMKQDVTDDYARWDLLRAQAECDPLTGIANRAPFQRFLDKSEPGNDGREIGALLLIDMDRFKYINDAWGHLAGDACLVALADRLKMAFPEAGLVSRIGGDEFAVVLPRLAVRREFGAMARRRIDTLLSPVAWNGNLLPISLSAGLAIVPQRTRLDTQALYLAADQALYDAKKLSRTVLVCA